MTGPFASLTQLLSNVILPNLKAVQQSQADQVAANSRLEQAIQDLRTHLELEFAQLATQLSACQTELTATQEALKTAQEQGVNGRRLSLLIQ